MFSKKGASSGIKVQTPIKVHEGVKSEIKYASGKAFRFVYWPKEDKLKGASPFAGDYDNPFENKDDFYNALNEIKPWD